MDLVHHPASPPSKPFRLWVNVDNSAAFGTHSTLNLGFGIDAPASRFHLPTSADPGRRDELWKTTCFEAFFQAEGEDGYREWNFSPSGDWAAYDFTTVREGMTSAALDHPPYVRVEDNLVWWTLNATIALEVGIRWRVGLTAVIEEVDGTKSYWALNHGRDAPDFHDPACFTARLG